MTNNKIQLSNHIYCDELFNTININNLLLPNQYKDFPYLIINDFFSSKLCKEIVDKSKKNDKINVAKVKANSSKGVIVPKVDQTFRKTNILKWNDEFKNIYQKKKIFLLSKSTYR